jgi:hypothetical protein
LDFSNLESFPATVMILLTDDFTRPKTEVDLRQKSVYPFEVTHDSLSFGSTRFQLTFTELQLPVTGLARQVVDGKFYPNPVTGLLSVELEDEGIQRIDLTIFNERGEETGKATLSDAGSLKEGQIDFGPYPAGLYFIRIPSGEKYSIVKIMKR